MRVRIFQRGRVWWIDARIGSRRHRRSLATTDRSVAVRARRRLEEQLAEGVNPFEGVSRAPSFDTYAAEWLERAERRLRPGTLENYKRAVREASAVLGSKPLDAITRRDARSVVDALRVNPRGRTRDRQTVLNLLVGLQALFHDALDAEVVTRNPFARAGKLLEAVGLSRRRRDLGDEARRPLPYTPDERVRLLGLLERADFPLYVAALLALRAGLRRSEVLGLRREDVAFGERAIYVRQRASRGDLDTPKSTTSRRRVPMSAALVLAIRRLLAENDRRALRLGREPSELLFPPLKQQGRTVLQNERRFAARFNRLLEQAEVAPRYHPFHDLRHAFASDLLGAGVPMLKVSRWLGHASIQTTVDTYGHLLPDPDEHETVDRLDALGTNGHKMGTLREKGRRSGRVSPRKPGAPGTTRTCDTRFRKPVLYPPELRGRETGT
jgi:integrase